MNTSILNFYFLRQVKRINIVAILMMIFVLNALILPSALSEEVATKGPVRKILDKIFPAPEFLPCQILIDIDGQTPTEKRISVRGFCESPEKRSLLVTLSDGQSVKKANCPSEVNLTTETYQVLCALSISNYSSIKIQAQLSGPEQISDVAIYRKFESFTDLPMARVLGDSNIKAEVAVDLKANEIKWKSEIRALIQDPDLDRFSSGFNRVDLILKSPQGDKVLESKSATGDFEEVRFQLERKYKKHLLFGTQISGDLEIGDNVLFLRVHDAFESGQTVDSELITITLENVGV